MIAITMLDLLPTTYQVFTSRSQTISSTIQLDKTKTNCSCFGCIQNQITVINTRQKPITQFTLQEKAISVMKYSVARALLGFFLPDWSIMTKKLRAPRHHHHILFVQQSNDGGFRFHVSDPVAKCMKKIDVNGTAYVRQIGNHRYNIRFLVLSMQTLVGVVETTSSSQEYQSR